MNNLMSLIEDAESPIPHGLRAVLNTLYEEYKQLKAKISDVENRLTELLKTEHLAQKLLEIPGVGLMSAALLIAKVGDGKQFKSGRDMAAWIGLVPRQHSTGGKNTLLGISKRGDSHLRRCLIHGARSVIQWQKDKSNRWTRWLKTLQETKKPNVVICAMANKLARIAWAVMTKDERFKANA